ncbi:nucleotide-binding protein, partial [Methylobacillus flagellatus]|uniref:nucleotide-binding protein n=1 Tax=Methylobacillus flagellatus TaxID=405 RepID=UPI0028694EF8
RVVKEYTAAEIRERYESFSPSNINELKKYPTLFVTEREALPTRIGYITEIRPRLRTIAFKYEFDENFPALEPGVIESIRSEIDLGEWELTRTHWAVKNEPIFDILVKKGYINQEQIETSNNERFSSEHNDPKVIPTEQGVFNTQQVFIVHGHDDITKLEVADFISGLNLEPIILHMQANSGRTIIEKIEHYSNVGFGIVLYTPCDIGQKYGALNSSFRARQNVVFEHGFLIGKLGRSRVAAIVKGDVETPNDISGVVYIPMKEDESWKAQIIKELKTFGFVQ